jgi:hypothetical protein
MIRVFPRKTKWTPVDDLSFIGDPPIIGRPDVQPVHVSCAFSWDMLEAERLYHSWSRFYPDVRLGGPAFGDFGEFDPGVYLKPGVTITSRGCPKSCPWCLTPEREGRIRELKIQPGTIVQDNNLLACSIEHVCKVFEMLKSQDRAIFFKGGLDVDFMTEEHTALLGSIKIGEMWFACDYPGAEDTLQGALHLIPDVTRRKKRCFTMIGFDGETVAAAERRLKRVFEMGFLPFAQLYMPPDLKKIHYDQDWLRLAKQWSRPAIIMTIMGQKTPRLSQPGGLF